MPPSTSLFALLVGIGTYADPNLDHLSFSVSDTHHVQGFLQRKLQVPTQNILLLIDQQATHDAIISHFRSHLIENPAITPGDPILFYFAGHGTQYLTHPDWPTDDKCLEAICPVDRGTQRADGGSFVFDICDKVLGGLLAELALVKGDNVTVVLDSCHSGSGTRSFTPKPLESLKARYAPPMKSETAGFEMLSQAAQIAGGTLRAVQAQRCLRHPDSASHVLLAACRQDQCAQESTLLRAGVFTRALLALLEDADLKSVTYASLMTDVHLLVSPVQTPQCEGRNKHRFIFDNKNHDSRLVVIIKDEDGALRVEAGAIHGISVGTVFTVRSHQLDPSDHVSVVAITVNTTFSLVRPTTASIPAGRFAAVSFWANYDAPIRISLQGSSEALPRQRQIQDILDHVNERGRDVSDVHLVQDKASPIVYITVNEQDIVFDRKDELITRTDTAPLFIWNRVDSLSDWDIINRVARFNMHLYRENPLHPYRDKLRLRLFKVVNGQLVGTDYMSNDAATLQHNDNNPDTNYAFVIQNFSNLNLWCSLYYFDPSDYSITNMYSPSSPSMLPPLKRNSPLTIGHGSSGVPPFTFTVRPGERRDAGFVRLFVSDQYADLALIEQGPASGVTQPQQMRRGALFEDGQWDTITAIIDVHRVP